MKKAENKIRKKGSGGSRPGAGAKILTDKCEQIAIYIKKSIIKRNGGKKKCKTILKKYLNEKYKQTLKNNIK